MSSQESFRVHSDPKLQGFESFSAPCPLVPNPILEHPVAKFVLSRAPAFMRAWQDETAHPAFRPLPNRHTTHAYGQCVPSSAVLFRWLTLRFPDETFSVESGYAYAPAKRATSLESLTHAWLHWLPKDSERTLRDIQVIDVTASQLGIGINTVVQSAHELVLRGVFYQSLRRFHDLESLYDQFSVREPGIRERVDLYRSHVLAAQVEVAGEERQELLKRFGDAGAFCD